MTDEKKMIEELVEETGNCYGRETSLTEKEIDYICNQPKAGRWIPCSERR